MKNLSIFVIFIVTILSCSTTNKAYRQSFWGELEENQNYLYSADSLSAVVDGELNSGSIVLFNSQKGDFFEVYVQKPSRKKQNKYTIKHYLYKPNFKRLGGYNTAHFSKLIEASIDTSRSYQLGLRGGCYFVNSNGNNIYVDKSFCNSIQPEPVISLTPTPTYNYGTTSPSSSSGNVHVKGYYRKDGTYVKPHTRSKPRKG
jgi:hypothetical protein